MELIIIKIVEMNHLLIHMVFLVHVLAELFYVWECQVHDASSCCPFALSSINCFTFKKTLFSESST